MDNKNTLVNDSRINCVLTIAVPTYNMERWLSKNLKTYYDHKLVDRLEVLCLNNASHDSSISIINSFVAKYPQIFSLIDRDNRGYGSSINEAIQVARGRYFRIVDADDWVDTNQLVLLIDALEKCEADIVLTDYQMVELQTGNMIPVKAFENEDSYYRLMKTFDMPRLTLPSIHNTVYCTELLRSSGFWMQDKTFFVDEEYITIPYLFAKSVIYYPFDVYRYQISDPHQSTSPENRAKYLSHRERVLKRLINVYLNAKEAGGSSDALSYCKLRIQKGIGDHFTTLLIYVEDHKTGKRLADKWENYVREEAKEFWPSVRKKVLALRLLNRFGVTLNQYETLKRCLIDHKRPKQGNKED